MKAIIKIAVNLSLVLVLLNCLAAPDVKAQEQAPFTTVTLSGEELFIQGRCVRCHTIGRGRFVGPDLAGVGNRYSKEEIVKWIENPQQIYQSTGKRPINEGYPPMPPLNIPEERAKEIAEYLTSYSVSQDSADTGSISGQVINETNDGPATGVELTLTSYMGDNPTGDKTIETDGQGNFLFDGLNWDRSYAISINFKGAQYSTDKMVFNPNEETKILNLPVYEPSFDEDKIEIVEAQMIVQIAEGALSVADLTLYNNAGDTVFVGGKETQDGRKEALRVSTPKEAQNINFIHGLTHADVVETEYGFAGTTSVLPGQKRIVYAYALPLLSGTTDFEKTIDYPTRSFLLLISESTESVTVKGLKGGESVEVHDEKFLKWTGENLKPGHLIKLGLKNPLTAGEYLKWGALGFLLIIILAGVIYSTVTKKGAEQDKNSNEDEGVGSLKAKHVAFIKEIAQLDDDFEAGNIEEQKHKNIRRDKIEELKKIKRRLR